MKVRIETIDPFELLTTRKTGPYHLSAPAAWTRLFTWLQANTHITPLELVGFGLDDPFETKEDLIRYVAGVKFQGEPGDSLEEDITPLSITGGRYAVHTMKGPYQQMPERFRALKTTWLETTDHQLDETRPFLEIYLNDPYNVKEEDYLTDLHLPIV